MFVIEIPHRKPATAYTTTPEDLICLAAEYYGADNPNFDEAVEAIGNNLHSFRMYQDVAEAREDTFDHQRHLIAELLQ